MGYFPFFMDIEGKNGLIAGGGRIALHKLQKLLPYGAKLMVVTPRISEELEQFAHQNDICVINRKFESKDLIDMCFVIAASDDGEVNAEIGRLCRERGILVNVVDDRERCSFIFPSCGKHDSGILYSAGGFCKNGGGGIGDCGYGGILPGTEASPNPGVCL